MLGEMTSQSRMKQYLKQTLYLVYQHAQWISKYWLDAKPDPGSKTRKKKSHEEKIHQRLLNTQNCCLWLKMSPGDRLSGAASARGESCCLCALLIYPPTAASMGLGENRGDWAGQPIGLAWCSHPYLLTLTVPRKYRKTYREECISLEGCCWLFLMASPGSSETPLDFSGVGNLASGQLKRVLH